MVQNSSDQEAAISEVILHGESIHLPGRGDRRAHGHRGPAGRRHRLRLGGSGHDDEPAAPCHGPVLILGNIPADYAVPQFYEIVQR